MVIDGEGNHIELVVEKERHDDVWWLKYCFLVYFSISDNLKGIEAFSRVCCSLYFDFKGGHDFHAHFLSTSPRLAATRTAPKHLILKSCYERHKASTGGGSYAVVWQPFHLL